MNKLATWLPEKALEIICTNPIYNQIISNYCRLDGLRLITKWERLESLLITSQLKDYIFPLSLLAAPSGVVSVGQLISSSFWLKSWLDGYGYNLVWISKVPWGWIPYGDRLFLFSSTTMRFTCRFNWKWINRYESSWWLNVQFPWFKFLINSYLINCNVMWYTHGCRPQD